MFNQHKSSHTAFGMHQLRLVACVAMTFVISSLSACGQKGPLKDPSLDETSQNQTPTFDSVSAYALVLNKVPSNKQSAS